MNAQHTMLAALAAAVTWQHHPGGALWPTTGVGDTIRVWIVAANRTRLCIAAATNEQATSSLKKDIQQIVESIRFASA
jgi:hypothetical protein